MNDKKVFTTNNFDLLRLFAALQVVIHHSVMHLGIEYKGKFLLDIFEVVPGVPVFFFISGYLISKSYENNSNIKEYVQNRVLRIYPAVFVCVLLSVLSVYLVGYYRSIEVPALQFLIWLFGQLSFYQFYNPDFMRAYGSGALNGSLWTITVELQFYILIPLLYFFIKRTGRYIESNKVLVVLIIIFLFFNRFYYLFHSEYKDIVWYKLFGVTFVPWFYMFLVGTFVQRNFRIFHNYLSNKFIIIFIMFSFYLWFMKSFLNVNTGNGIGPLIFIPMVIVLFSAAYSNIRLSNILLHKNDISYGVYIYHMPVINMMIYLGYKGDISFLIISIVLTVVLSSLSWKIVEYPSLMLKKHPLNPLNKNS